MKVFIIFFAVLACAFARPSIPAAPLTYYTAPLTYAKLIPGAPIGPDGRVVDTPEVAFAKAEHAAAHVNQKIALAQEAAQSADLHVISYSAPIAAAAATVDTHLVQSPIAVTKLVPGAPIGLDGRVVDTPEVALAKAEHAAAHVNEKLGHEAAKFASHETSFSTYAAPLVYSYVY